MPFCGKAPLASAAGTPRPPAPGRRWRWRATPWPGGFLFLGILLGGIFLLATALILYYKQVSEGYEDRGRFEIMRKVGLSQREVRASIRSQVLLVFFLPIAAAAVHILFDFNMVVKLLSLLSVRSVGLIAACTGGTLLVFLAVYGLMYLLTARTYYKIVR